jgi:hypothetical protein
MYGNKSIGAAAVNDSRSALECGGQDGSPLSPSDSNSKRNSNSNSISTGKSIMSIKSTNRNARVSSLWTLLHAACVPWQY